MEQRQLVGWQAHLPQMQQPGAWPGQAHWQGRSSPQPLRVEGPAPAAEKSRKMKQERMAASPLLSRGKKLFLSLIHI